MMMVMRKESKKEVKGRKGDGVSARASIIGPSIKPYHLCSVSTLPLFRMLSPYVHKSLNQYALSCTIINNYCKLCYGRSVFLQLSLLTHSQSRAHLLSNSIV